MLSIKKTNVKISISILNTPYLFLINAAPFGAALIMYPIQLLRQGIRLKRFPARKLC
jgi:hypothetical protein